MEQLEINLTAYVHPQQYSLVGRERGELMVAKIDKAYDLTNAEKIYDEIHIVVPEHVITMNKSFFLGFFELIVQRLGRDVFLAKYQFITSTHIKSRVKVYSEAALFQSDQKDILDA